MVWHDLWVIRDDLVWTASVDVNQSVRDLEPVKCRAPAPVRPERCAGYTTRPMRTGEGRSRPLKAPVLVLATLATACTSPVAVDDPFATLSQPGEGPRRLLGAMVALDSHPDEKYLDALTELLWIPGYTVASRRQAFDRLLEYDEQRLKRTIRRRLPSIGARLWQEQLCGLIVEHGWVDLSPALVSAWARMIPYVDDFARVEYDALVELYGSREGVVDAVFELLVESRSPTLRTRCWELLYRIGYHQRLIALLEAHAVDPDDAMLADLRAAALDLGVVPRNREEILWVRKLRDPSRAEFWSQATLAVQSLSQARRMELELRDLPIVVAASIHDPELLRAEKQTLYDRLAERLAGRRKYIDSGRYQGFPGSYDQYLAAHRSVFTWGDLAAMTLALRALDVPQVARHLRAYAEDDRLDKTTEYGGVIRLDSAGRFEVVEFRPKFRTADNRFVASQAMLDSAYTAVFHFHFHAQKYDNRHYAAPGIGDLNYAENLRANCLVFSFVNEDTMNMDYYRHTRVIVDLGEVVRH